MHTHLAVVPHRGRPDSGAVGMMGRVATTAYPELDAVLTDLVGDVRGILGADLVGVYLQGSFAAGDADEHSDVDFVVVTADDVSSEQEPALAVMHAAYPDRPVPWAQHLEGSYVPRKALRRLDPVRTPWLYVGNGGRVLERSAHDNTAVVRWTVREHGVALAGPAPTELIDPVSGDDLREEVRRTVELWAQDDLEPGDGLDRLDNAWTQTHTVLAYCRILHTLATGTVGSKRAAGEWSIGHLDRRWAPLIRQALADRADPWERLHQPARPGSVGPTHGFVRYALQAARAQGGD